MMQTAIKMQQMESTLLLAVRPSTAEMDGTLQVHSQLQKTSPSSLMGTMNLLRH